MKAYRRGVPPSRFPGGKCFWGVWGGSSLDPPQGSIISPPVRTGKYEGDYYVVTRNWVRTHVGRRVHWKGACLLGPDFYSGALEWHLLPTTIFSTNL